MVVTHSVALRQMKGLVCRTDDLRRPADVGRHNKAIGLLYCWYMLRGLRRSLLRSITSQPSLRHLRWLVGSRRVLRTHYQPYQASPPVDHRFPAGSQRLPVLDPVGQRASHSASPGLVVRRDDYEFTRR